MDPKTHVAGVLAKLEWRDRVQSTGGRSTSSARAPFSPPSQLRILCGTRKASAKLPTL